MAKLEFLGALFNEEDELADLIGHVAEYVDKLNFVDDGSTDQTESILEEYSHFYPIEWRKIAHTGLPETVKNEALKLVADRSWVLMLDADERLAPGVLDSVTAFLKANPATEYTHIYFRQVEMLDGRATREFRKSKLFRKEAIKFPLHDIHADDQFEGPGIYVGDWTVYHRKTTNKQVERETEYLRTYKQLLLDGHIDQGRYEWLTRLHYFVKPKG